MEKQEDIFIKASLKYDILKILQSIKYKAFKDSSIVYTLESQFNDYAFEQIVDQLIEKGITIREKDKQM